MGRFTAHAQYDDYKPENCQVAADDADNNRLHDYLKKHHDLKANESVFGIKFYSGERYTSMKILLIDTTGFETVAEAIRNAPRPIPVRIAEIEKMTADEFLKFFKRFSLVMSRQPVIGEEATFED